MSDHLVVACHDRPIVTQDGLTEMCNVFMLTGLDWISDGQKVVTDSHGVSVGMKKMFKYHYHNQ